MKNNYVIEKKADDKTSYSRKELKSILDIIQATKLTSDLPIYIWARAAKVLAAEVLALREKLDAVDDLGLYAED